MRYSILAALIMCLTPPVLAQGRPPLTDHSLISAYEGSVMRRKDVREFDEYSAFTGMDESGKEPTTLALEGKVTKMMYKAPANRSTLEVFRNYENAIALYGAEVLYTCNQDKLECVARYAGPTFQKVSDIHSMSNLEGRYLLAKIVQDEQTAYVAIAVGQASTTIHVVEVKNMDLGMVMLDAAALGKGLDALGYVIVEGIYFDTDKATLQAQSSTALEQMAKLLGSRPNLKVYVVGHTDSRGHFAHNRTLSQDRATAVVDALAADHGVSRSRMEGHGVGPLAPQASNDDDVGRARNRRVVMVAR
ncbi:MAG: OmpA family protein [Gammaproteobacteria bacterium]|nr:OmpA family protein [Gammaproteobacteria bacterium]